MKKLISLLIGLCALSVTAQTVTIRVVANDGAVSSTNAWAVTPIKVQGLLANWRDDSRAKTNALGTNAVLLTFGTYIEKELKEKGEEWNRRGGIEAIKSAGLTNSVPPARLAEVWDTLTASQKTNAIWYLKNIGQ